MLFCSSFVLTAQQLYTSSAVEADFFSSAPLEDIRAVSKEGVSVINSETGEISFRININTFSFKKALMQEHFNEKFMESDKFPTATFRGKIQDYIDLSKDGEHSAVIQGVLEIHGIKKKRKVPASVVVRDGVVNLKSRFQVACRDHNIEIPKLLWKNVAEVVDVQIVADYTKHKK